MPYGDFFELGIAGDRAGFERKLVSIAQAMDFDIASAAIAVDRPGQAPIFELVGNTPEAWQRASKDPANFKRDPVLARMRSTALPFIYDQSTYVQADAGDLWEIQAPHGYKTGIAMAMHMPGGRHFLLGVDRSTPMPKGGEVVNRLIADLCMLAVHAQEAAVRVLLDEPADAAPVPRLGKRELEMLQWTKEGKSSWAISTILGISESTVETHMRSLRRKMGVSSKHQAVLRAITLGLISE
jgi:DNA-binding CsgD family transcriptional regulator